MEPQKKETAAAPKVEAAAPVNTPAVDAKAIAQEAIKAERDRVAMIKAVCKGEFPEIEAKAAMKDADMPLADILSECMRIEGMSVPRTFDNQAINVLADENLKIVSSPYLSNSKYAGSSEASWYLFGKPGVVDTFEIGAAPQPAGLPEGPATGGATWTSTSSASGSACSSTSASASRIIAAWSRRRAPPPNPTFLIIGKLEKVSAGS